MHTSTYRRDLGNGLVMRWSTVEDTEKIAVLHGLVHRESADAPSNTRYMAQIRALMRGDYPLMGAGDFALVEDTSRAGSPVVASACLWRQTWSYEGMAFGVGRPEAVATDPAYRRRGLVRSLFEMLHARSAASGDLVQAITGIAYFYRQFGYEYALELEDRRSTLLSLIPPGPVGEPEAAHLRPATLDDIPLMQRLYSRRQGQNIVSELPRYEQWLYEIETWQAHPAFGHTFSFMMILNPQGETIGFVACDAIRRGRALGVWLLECVEGVNVQALLPSLLRALQNYAQSIAAVQPQVPALEEISLSLGTTHPVHQLLGPMLDYPREPSYAWYLRVANLPAFLLHIAPVLEQRLANSPLAGLSREIHLDFYRGGLRMVFEQGRLVSTEAWQVPLYGPGADCAFPPLTFLQVLFGHRSSEELRYIFPDIWISDEIRPILHTLFPTRPSFVFTWN